MILMCILFPLYVLLFHILAQRLRVCLKTSKLNSVQNLITFLSIEKKNYIFQIRCRKCKWCFCVSVIWFFQLYFLFPYLNLLIYLDKQTYRVTIIEFLTIKIKIRN